MHTLHYYGNRSIKGLLNGLLQDAWRCATLLKVGRKTPARCSTSAPITPDRSLCQVIPAITTFLSLKSAVYWGLIGLYFAGSGVKGLGDSQPTRKFQSNVQYNRHVIFFPSHIVPSACRTGNPFYLGPSVYFLHLGAD
ncbi:hypothetical protein I7I50_10370 [Histoplasma capsulatum G186AR]|uniref:Uncharacterized protein n=1 Tax=Ajellomyces capsulatus TaxID=5037 RepID=A0A8H7Z6C3_AJECA|nr:hypothetical protein I7I52_01609 [Histoplasma capsulatum]QSS69173.1 hypothetical protein I7I50_10370 [Histoplasma capsulatum G186AR]